MVNIQQLFDLAIHYGYISYKNGLNGQESWSKLKDEMDSSQICKWQLSRKFSDGRDINDIRQIYLKIHDDLQMHGEDGDMDKYHITKKQWERFHFVLQTARIPKNSHCSLQKIIQIAFNIGQYRSANKKDSYSLEVNKFITDNNLDKVESYIDLHVCKISDKLLDKSIKLIKDTLPTLHKGGMNKEYYTKYLKYKNKYLNFKDEFIKCFLPYQATSVQHNQYI
jgi:hypothetical protein